MAVRGLHLIPLREHPALAVQEVAAAHKFCLALHKMAQQILAAVERGLVALALLVLARTTPMSTVAPAAPA